MVSIASPKCVVRLHRACGGGTGGPGRRARHHRSLLAAGASVGHLRPTSRAPVAIAGPDGSERTASSSKADVREAAR